MMGEANPQRGLFYNISLETFVPEEHPLRRIRPLIDERVIRRAYRDLYAPKSRRKQNSSTTARVIRH